MRINAHGRKDFVYNGYCAAVKRGQFIDTENRRFEDIFIRTRDLYEQRTERNIDERF